MADYINKIRTTEGDKPVNYEALANKPNSLPNPNKIKFTGSVVAEYDGSSEVTVNIQNGASEEQAAQIQTNTNDISELKNKTSELKSDLSYKIGGEEKEALTMDANNAPAGLVYLTPASTNLPTQNNYYYYMCTIHADSVNYKKQFAFDVADNKLYSRNYNDGIGWSVWEDIAKSKCSNVVTVAKMGGDYATIQDAVNRTEIGATIIVYPGVYEESVNMYGKERHIVGIDKNTCILTNGTGSYYTNPLMCGIGSIENMTVIADTYNSTASIEDTTPKPYAIHIECANADDYTFRIDNCILYSKWNPAVGIGVRHNQTVIIENSELKTDCTKSYFGDNVGWKKQGALFAHNDATGSNLGNNGHLIVKNSILHGANCGLSLQPVENNNVLTIDFINTTIYDDENGVSDATIYQVTGTPTEGYISGSVIKLGILSHGNIQERLNAN